MTEHLSSPPSEEVRHPLDAFVNRFVDSQETTPELLKDCLWRLSEALKEVTNSQRRIAAALLTSVATFELINRNLVGGAALLGMKLARLNFLLIALPVAVAYTLARLAALGRNREVCLAAYYRLAHRAFPGLYASHIDRLLAYSEGLVFSRVPKIYLSPRGRWIGTALPIVEPTVYFLMVPGFEVYAFCQLFAKKGAGDLGVWAALLIVIGLVILVAALSRTSFHSWLIDDREYGELYLGNPPDPKI
jgi:hypothetical protein